VKEYSRAAILSIPSFATGRWVAGKVLMRNENSHGEGTTREDTGVGILLERHACVEDLTGRLPGFEGLRVSILREDLRHPIAGGNKLWKLQHVLREARQLAKRRLVTVGGAYSNHLLATAWVGAACSFETLGHVRGEVDSRNPVLRVCSRLGMRLSGMSRADYRTGVVPDMAEGDYWIPEGGTCPLAVEGVAGLIRSLTGRFHHVVVAVGTGGTLAGVAKGLRQRPEGGLAHGILVVEGAADSTRNRVEALAPECDPWRLWTEYCEGRYGRWTARIQETIDRTLRSTGVALDPVYTGKMVAGAERLAERGEFRKGEHVLLFHTGGFAAAWQHLAGGEHPAAS